MYGEADTRLPPDSEWLGALLPGQQTPVLMVPHLGAYSGECALSVNASAFMRLPPPVQADEMAAKGVDKIVCVTVDTPENVQELAKKQSLQQNSRVRAPKSPAFTPWGYACTHVCGEEEGRARVSMGQSVHA